MLKDRVKSAVLMALVFLVALFILPKIGFLMFVSFATAAAAWEWSALAGLKRRHQRMTYVCVLFVLISACAGMLGFGSDLEAIDHDRIQYFVLIDLVWWFVALFLVRGYPDNAKTWGSQAGIMVIGGLVLIPTWIGLTFLRSEHNGSWLILFLVTVVASADIGAYFSGRKFGKRRLAPSVSPGKSWEGVFGGLSLAVLLAVVVGYFWMPDNRLSLILLVAATALVSVLGDLLESMIKRHRGVKDSGYLFPGHGGILDRVDGITAAAPVFSLGLLLLGLQFPAN
ncbi:phosphatidate cytidylyltransferase [Sessilibacter sp. MAH2]